jgi:hypothetical protein
MKNLMTRCTRTLTLAFILVFFFSAANPTKADNRVKKYTVLHNGHEICIPWPAVVSHLREHEDDVLEGCCSNCVFGAD